MYPSLLEPSATARKTQEDVTILLRQLGRGDRAGFDRLIELIYPELRRLARGEIRRERPGHMLQPTALVNEAYVRLVAHENHNWENRRHFFGAAAKVMRRILVDHARARNARKRVGEPPDIAPNQHETGDSSSLELIALDLALDELQRRSSRQAQIVELRYFTGLTVPEIAVVLGLNARTVDRDWATARAWLRRQLQG